jgi:hypothetical protein
MEDYVGRRPTGPACVAKAVPQKLTNAEDPLIAHGFLPCRSSSAREHEKAVLHAMNLVTSSHFVVDGQTP